MFRCAASQSRSFSRCAGEVPLDHLAGGRRLAQPGEHLLLREDHLVQVALHEDDAILLVRGQLVEELETILKAFPLRRGQPGDVFLDLLDLLELVVAAGVVGVGRRGRCR